MDFRHRVKGLLGLPLLALSIAATPRLVGQPVMPGSNEPVNYDANLPPGTPVAGSVSFVAPFHQWRWYSFRVTSGTLVTVNLVRTSGDILLNALVYTGTTTVGNPVSLLGAPTITSNNATLANYSFSFLPGSTANVTLCVTSAPATNGGAFTATVATGGTLTATGLLNPFVLTKGTILAGLANATTNHWNYYTFSVPPEARNLRITTSGGAGDVDIYLRKGDVPTPGNGFDKVSGGGTTTELIAVLAPQAGTYYLGLLTFAPYSGVNLQMDYVYGAAANVDFSGDGIADKTIFRPSNGGWYTLLSEGGISSLTGWGSQNGDIPVPGDYDGDGKADRAIFRPSNGGWYILLSAGGIKTVTDWGSVPGDLQVPADYDGDGITDLGIFRPSTGSWYVQLSGGGIKTVTGWGSQPGDLPIPADYDGDGKADVAIFRPSNGGWYIINSSDGTTRTQVDWGSGNGDIPVPGDYDGDGKADLAIFRPLNGGWYILQSSGGIRTLTDWGSAPGDMPIPTDFDGDGKVDPAIFRPSNGGWYAVLSGGGMMTTTGWGTTSGDCPLPLVKRGLGGGLYSHVPSSETK